MIRLACGRCDVEWDSLGGLLNDRCWFCGRGDALRIVYTRWDLNRLGVRYFSMTAMAQ
jgi:hypothetical protein